MLKKILGIGFKNCIFIHKKGTVTFLLPKDELDRFGKKMAKNAEKNEKYALNLLIELKNNTDRIMSIMNGINNKIPTLVEYEKFAYVFRRHLAFHNFMKKSVDYLSPKMLEKLLPHFKDARIYSEPVYSRTEEFFRELTTAIGKKENFNFKLLVST